MRSSRPALGDITGAIIVMVVFAVATPILVHMFYERADVSAGIIKERLDRQHLMADEQIGTSGTLCSNDGITALLHNYGRTSFDSSEIKFFRIGQAGEFVVMNRTGAGITDLDGAQDPVISSGDTVTVWGDIRCGEDRLLLRVPSGDQIVIRP